MFMSGSRPQSSISGDDWPFNLDSGTSDHMVTCLEWLSNVRNIAPQSIIVGNGTRVYAEYSGTLSLKTSVEYQGDVFYKTVVLKQVLFVPELQSNLLSCSTLCRDGYRINFRSDKCVGLLDGMIRFQGSGVNGVYRLHGRPVHTMRAAANVAQSDNNGRNGDSSMTLWHHRLGHVHIESIKRLYNNGAVTGISFKHMSKRMSCGSCIKGKQTKRTLGVNKSRATVKGAVIHTDVCGPMSVRSFSGARYFVSFVDE